jgi:hypothetical protein
MTMKHALSGSLILLVLLAGCAADPEPGTGHQVHFAAARPEPSTVRETTLPPAQPATTGSLPDAGEHSARNERQVYAQGLEKILVTNGVSVSVLSYEGRVNPSPTLMFVGYFSRDFVARALTNGAVLQRAKELGFKSVDFFDRGPDGHYQFVVSKTAPLPKCATYNRMCL